jgi:glucose-6-phosphate isomerase
MTKIDLDKRVEIAKALQLINETHSDTLKALAESERRDRDREFTLEMAEHVWQKVKGYPIPECYSEEDRLSIFERYYHRAVSQSQGE